MVGRKAIGLHRLRALGLPVPHWITLTTKPTGQRAAGVRAPWPDREATAAGRSARERRDAPRSLEVRRSLEEVERLKTCAPLAVRSSAVDEDAEAASFAGQNETFLNVTSFAALEEAVRGCWASLFSERSVAYRAQRGMPLGSTAMAVVVQEMIDPDASGVLFTADPVSGRSDRTVVSSLWGLGEGLVSGRLDADTFTLDQSGRLIEQRIATKATRLVRDDGGGVRLDAVAVGRADAPSLDRDQLRRLVAIGGTVKTAWGGEVDVEFCVRGSETLLLQARPITALGGGGRARRQHLLVWDNANIVESYSGITLPLTFTFIRLAYRGVYVQFAELLGLGPGDLRRREELFWNMLGLIEGRVYYNLLNWYRLVALMPAFQANRRFMEQMMGLTTPVEELAAVQASWRANAWRLLKTAARMVWLHATLARRIEAFHRSFAAIRREYATRDYGRMRPWEVLAAFDELKARLLWQWKAPILNDFEAMIFYGLLKRLTEAWIGADRALQNDLLCGGGGIRSTELIDGLRTVAAKIAEDPGRRDAFLAMTPQQAVHLVREDPRFAEANRALEAYFETFGVRCVHEMKLESVPMREDPAFCMAVVRSYLVASAHAASAAPGAEAIRVAAEERLDRQLRWRLTGWGLPKRPIFRWVLANARNAVKNRENQRLARAETYAMVRQMFRSIGDAWAGQGLLGNPRDVFFLELDEIRSFIEGTATCTDLKGLVALRRREYDSYQDRVPDDHIETEGVVYSGNLFRRAVESGATGQTLSGLGACPGRVEAAARVVLVPDAGLRLNGEILVARETDPGWTVLFPAISGLVVEKGSMLSHSAIVAREMGIPAVVGVKDATRCIRDGQRVRLDGAAGTVTLLD
jgi:pyruvate,water dikinase